MESDLKDQFISGDCFRKVVKHGRNSVQTDRRRLNETLSLVLSFHILQTPQGEHIARPEGDPSEAEDTGRSLRNHIQPPLDLEEDLKPLFDSPLTPA